MRRTGDQQGYRGQRTLGVPEAFVWSLWDEGMDLIKRRGFVDEQGRVYFDRKWQEIWLKPRTIRRPDGRRFRLETVFYSGHMTEGAASPNPEDPERSIRLSLSLPVRTPIEGPAAEDARSTLAHELTHALDPVAFRGKNTNPNVMEEGFKAQMEALEDDYDEDRISRSEYRSRMRDLIETHEGSAMRRYYNNPTEVNAWRHNVHRNLSTAAVGRRVRDLAARGVPRHKIVNTLLADDERWQLMVPYLSTANKRKMLETAAYVVQAHLDDEGFQTIRLAARVAQRWVRAVAPVDLDLNKTYYHGTKNEKAGKAIQREGIQPPDLALRSDRTRPVEGKVYITPDLEYAVIYALGWVGAGLETSPAEIRRNGRYGYLFVIPGRELKDIQPDEDSIGEMVYREQPRWLHALAVSVLDGVYSEKPDRMGLSEEFQFEWLDEGDQEDFLESIGVDEFDWSYGADLQDWLTDHPDADDESYWEHESITLLDEVMGGTYSAWAEAGKLLLPHLDDEEQLELIERGAHIAHTGALKPSQCWRIDKHKSRLLRSDASNFFEVAERC